jgi:tetratricopeptide (TPR) repeat protein
MWPALLLCLLFNGLMALPAKDETIVKAEKLLYRTDYVNAIKALDGISGSGPAEFVRGQAHYYQGDFKKASAAFEEAVKAQPNESNYHLWLGRALGRRAETASPFTAPGLATKARDSFQKAVDLNPKNIDALDDLFQYCMEAPGFLGGGTEKARRIAERMKPVNEGQYHYALAQLALKSKEFGVAEQQLRAAAKLAPKQVGRLLDLAKFLARRGRLPEAEQAFAQAERVSPNAPLIKFSRAEAYIETKTNLTAAKSLLQEYLRADLTTEDPSRAEAQKLLRGL